MSIISFLIFILIPNPAMAGGLDDDSPLQKACQKYLLGHEPYTLADVRAFNGSPVILTREDNANRPANTQTLRIYTHPWVEPLYFLEPPNLKRFDERETADAIEYAEYLKTQNKGFLFVPLFMGASVPDFDGVEFDLKTGIPLFNVSLKHADRVVRPMTPTEFSESLAVWATGEQGWNVESQDAWFRAVNSTSNKDMRKDSAVVGVNSFTRFKMLALVFGLFNHNGIARPVKVVRDLSDRGISFDTARGPEFRTLIEQSIGGIQTNAMTAIWDRDHVWEFPFSALK